MSSQANDKRTVTKRELATRVRLAIKPELKLHQSQVTEVISETLDAIRDSLANGKTVELRNFGVFKIETRKQRIGRNRRTRGGYSDSGTLSGQVSCRQGVEGVAGLVDRPRGGAHTGWPCWRGR